MISQYPNGLSRLSSCNCESLGAMSELPQGLDYTDAGDWAQLALRFTNDWVAGRISPSNITAVMDLFNIDAASQPALRNAINSAIALATTLGWTDAELQTEIRRVLAVAPPAMVVQPAANNTMLYVALAVVAVLLLKK